MSRRRLSTLADEHREAGEKKTGARVHCGFWPRRAHGRCGISGIGERQGGVKGDESRLVARRGSRRRALARARAEQRRWRYSERVEHMPDPVSTRGHHPGMVKTTPTIGQTLSGLKSMQ